MPTQNIQTCSILMRVSLLKWRKKRCSNKESMRGFKMYINWIIRKIFKFESSFQPRLTSFDMRTCRYVAKNKKETGVREKFKMHEFFSTLVRQSPQKHLFVMSSSYNFLLLCLLICIFGDLVIDYAWNFKNLWKLKI